MHALNAFRLRVLHFLGIDRAVVLAVTGKAWSTAAGLITALLVASFFPPELQGYYYTFFSVLALQVFAELGLGIVLTSYSSHEWAQLGFDQYGNVTGDEDALSRLTSLGRFALRWYLAAGASLMIGLAVGGFLFFGSTGWSQVSVWGWPWVALCLVTGANLCLVPFWALLEGCNQVSNVYAYRLVQSISVSGAAWLAIYLGAGLWVVPIIGLAALLATLGTIGSRYTRFFSEIMLSQPKGLHLGWQADILPMQWRVALSWLSGYFTFSLFTPVLFHYHGAVVAGQMGMTWAFIGALTGVASSWIAVKAPAFGILIAQHKYTDLDKMFWRLTAVVVTIALAGALCIWTFVYALGELHHPLAVRMLPASTTAYLLLATIIMAASLPMSTYLRAHKKEPLLALSLVSGLVTGFTVVVFGKYYAAEGVAIGYLTTTATITPFVALIWSRRRAEWHTKSIGTP